MPGCLEEDFFEEDEDEDEEKVDADAVNADEGDEDEDEDTDEDNEDDEILGRDPIFNKENFFDFCLDSFSGCEAASGLIAAGADALPPARMMILTEGPMVKSLFDGAGAAGRTALAFGSEAGEGRCGTRAGTRLVAILCSCV